MNVLSRKVGMAWAKSRRPRSEVLLGSRRVPAKEGGMTKGGKEGRDGVGNCQVGWGLEVTQTAPGAAHYLLL